MNAITKEDLKVINRDFESAEPNEVILWARGIFGASLVMTSSFGADSSYALGHVTAIVPRIPVIALDPRYLFEETRAYMSDLEGKFGLNVKIYYGDLSPEEMEAAFGRLWEQGDAGVRQYHEIWKIRPLQRAFRELKAGACISGVRREQTENRAGLAVVECRDDGVFRIHPFLNKTKEDVGSYMRELGLPPHPLVAKGFDSIGCRFLTKPGTGRTGRQGMGGKMECGLHLADGEASGNDVRAESSYS